MPGRFWVTFGYGQIISSTKLGWDWVTNSENAEIRVGQLSLGAQ